jgi:hypothetical protein
VNLLQLDEYIPKRWRLRLRRYPPFFKNPAPFYFECRQFIDKLKNISENDDFPMDKLPDLLFILDTYSKKNPDLISVAQKIIDLISPEQYQQINHFLLSHILLKFNPKNNETVVLNYLLFKIPTSTYKDIISLLTLNRRKELTLIKWCGRLAGKFTLEDKLNLLISLPKQIILSQGKLLHSLTLAELETRVSAASEDIPKTSIDSEQFVSFILEGQKYLNFSPQLLFIFFNHWIEAKKALLLSYERGLDIEDRFNFFKNLLISRNNTPENNQKFLHLCPLLQRALFIDKLIEYFFKFFISDLNQITALNARPPENDPRFLVLMDLLENRTNYSLNLFQLLALSHLAEKPIEIKKIKLDAVFFFEHAKHLPIELQEYVAEKSIQAIKSLIKAKQDRKILLALLNQLYSLLENPAIEKAKQQRLMAP